MSEEKEDTVSDISRQLEQLIDMLPGSVRSSMKQNLLTSALFADIERKHEWMKWAFTIPFIKWPENWFVRAVPPFHGAVIRYHVKNDLQSNEQVSIYLDCYDMLGCYGSPYWEVHNTKFEGSEPGRCSMEDIDGEHGLIHLIKVRLREIPSCECHEEEK